MSGKEATEKLKRRSTRSSFGSCRWSSLICRTGSRRTANAIIIVFEGRDGAGKGGTIKALTERVSPRVFRVVALPAPSDREKSQMYMQRYMEHFPAAGEIVIFDRSWYNRAGVEHVMGFCTHEQHKRFLKLCPERREVHRRRWHPTHQDLAGGGPGRTGPAVRGAHRRSAPAVEAEPDGRRVVRALVRLLQGARPDVRAHRHGSVALVHCPFGRQEARAAECHRAHPVADSLQEDASREGQAAGALRKEEDTTIRRHWRNANLSKRNTRGRASGNGRAR